MVPPDTRQVGYVICTIFDYTIIHSEYTILYDTVLYAIIQHNILSYTIRHAYDMIMNLSQWFRIAFLPIALHGYIWVIYMMPRGESRRHLERRLCCVGSGCHSHTSQQSKIDKIRRLAQGPAAAVVAVSKQHQPPRQRQQKFC